MKAFEFGRNTFDTKSSSHAEFRTLLKMVPYGACFHFIGPFCYKALTINAEKMCKKQCLRLVLSNTKGIHLSRG